MAAFRTPDDLFSGFVFEASLRQSRCTGIAAALFLGTCLTSCFNYSNEGPWKHTWLGVYIQANSISQKMIYLIILLPFTYGHGPFVTEWASSHFQGGGPPDLGVELEKIFGNRTCFGHTKSKAAKFVRKKVQLALADDFSQLSTPLPSKLLRITSAFSFPVSSPHIAAAT